MSPGVGFLSCLPSDVMPADMLSRFAELGGNLHTLAQFAHISEVQGRGTLSKSRNKAQEASDSQVLLHFVVRTDDES